MKICLINNLYKPYAVGGAEKVVEERAKKYAAEGNEVLIITSRPYQGLRSLKPEIGNDGKVVIYRFYVPNLCWYKDLVKHNFLFKLIWHKIDIFNFWSARIIYKILKQEIPNVIETHNLMGVGSYPDFAVTKSRILYFARKQNRDKVLKSVKSDIKWIHYLHDVQLVEPSGVLPWNHTKDKWYQKIYSWIMKWRMGNPDLVISPSEFLKNFYKSRGFFGRSEWKVEKISNFQFPISNQIQNSNIKFLFVGSLVEHKGVGVLMQAWDALCHCEEPSQATKQSQVVSLNIVGSGILEDKVKKWAKQYSNIKVLGRLEGQELEEIYKNSDVLIFPSICLENRPTVILEAQKYGLKIIASDTGGVAELVNKESLIKPGDVEALKNALLLNC